MDRDSLLDPADPRPEVRRRVADWLRFARVFGPGGGRALAAWRRDGCPARALARAGAPRFTVDRDVAALARSGFQVLPIDSPAYPPDLARIADAAPLLFVRGQIDRLTAPAVAVVGARAATGYGLGVARRLATGLAERGVGVVSGLARGIDGAAHRAALDAGGTTAAVLGCGPDLVYPPEHTALADTIARSGAVVTELPPGTPPLRAFFPLRNRLISGLARLVVVVEARDRSGSLHTARHALDQGVEVMAVPGPVDRAAYRGSNRLLRDGAAPVLGIDDLLDRLGPLPAAQKRSRPAQAALSPTALRVRRALAADPTSRDDLVARLGGDSGGVAAGLMELELRGLAQRERDGCWRLVEPDPDPD